MSEPRLKVDVNGGKYTVIMEEDGKLYALRYGEEWRDLCGDNLVYWLAADLEEARGVIKWLAEKSGLDPKDHP